MAWTLSVIFVLLIQIKFIQSDLSYRLSDRDDLEDRQAVEEFETDIALGLKSQLLIHHGEPLLFARLLMQIIPLRTMTALHMEDILNSPLEADPEAEEQGVKDKLGSPLTGKDHCINIMKGSPTKGEGTQLRGLLEKDLPANNKNNKNKMDTTPVPSVSGAINRAVSKALSCPKIAAASAEGMSNAGLLAIADRVNDVTAVSTVGGNHSILTTTLLSPTGSGTRTPSEKGSSSTPSTPSKEPSSPITITNPTESYLTPQSTPPHVTSVSNIPFTTALHVNTGLYYDQAHVGNGKNHLLQDAVIASRSEDPPRSEYKNAPLDIGLLPPNPRPDTLPFVPSVPPPLPIRVPAVNALVQLYGEPPRQVAPQNVSSSASTIPPAVISMNQPLPPSIGGVSTGPVFAAPHFSYPVAGRRGSLPFPMRASAEYIHSQRGRGLPYARPVMSHRSHSPGERLPDPMLSHTKHSRLPGERKNSI